MYHIINFYVLITDLDTVVFNKLGLQRIPLFDIWMFGCLNKRILNYLLALNTYLACYRLPAIIAIHMNYCCVGLRTDMSLS